MSIEDLRLRALASATSRPARLVKCLDEAGAAVLDAAQRRVDAARQTVADLEADDEGRGRRPKRPRSLGEPAEPEASAADARADYDAAVAELDRVEAGLPPDGTVVVKFRWVKPSLYSAVLAKHQPAGGTALGSTAWYEAFGDELCELCFLGCETLAGEPVGLTWEELAGQVLNHGEVEQARQLVMSHNRSLTGVTFRL
jgi:hypothetical protein